MERTITIKYNWKRVNSSDETVLDHHVEYLEESAFRRISEMLEQGYTSGELLDNITTIHDEEDHEGDEYQGYWTVEKE